MTNLQSDIPVVSRASSQGLICPNCAAVVPVPEGARIVHCPFCDHDSLVQGDRGTRRWQLRNQVERPRAEQALRGFFTGLNKAINLRRQAQIRELFLVYLPYWRVQAFVAGYRFGQVKSGDSSKPHEVEVMADMVWKDAAADVSEFGVHRIDAGQNELQPYDEELLQAEAMVFQPAESQTEALAESTRYFEGEARKKGRSLNKTYFEQYHILRPQLSLLYYPLWVGRYEYKERNYQVVIDGLQGKVLYGKAPGNIIYRAAALVAGMALGNCLLVNGAVISGLLLDSADGDDSLALLCIPVILGLFLIGFAYSAFRYGEEIEYIDPAARKAVGSQAGLLDLGPKSVASMLEQLRGKG
jgi:hypothetical protein